jgi:sarcosine oxidase subunit gamma
MPEAATRTAPQLPAGQWLRTLPPAQRFILHGDERARAAAAPVWGVDFAETPCLAREQNSRATLWLGPDEYLMLGADADSESTAADALERALGGIPHALVNISHRQFAIEVSGPHAAAILNGACPLDLDLREFPLQMCTRTVLAKADIVLWRTRADAFHLEVWRSFSGYVGALLREIATEFYGE